MSDLDIEGFMGHDPNAGGRGGSFLRGWRKRTPPVVHVWLHTKTLFKSLWQHNLPIVRVLKDKETGAEKRVVWSQSFNCHEDEPTLSDKRRDKDTGKRLIPFKICPVCKLLEHVRMEIRAGRLGFTQPIFQFETGEPDTDGNEEKRILHAGGMWGGFNDNMSDREREAVRKAGIKLTEAWRENGNAKCNYLFVVVDDDHPDEGIQIAIETSLVGDKMKQVLRQNKKKHGINGPWNPLATPYAFAWEHHPKAKTFNEKYEAYDMPSLPLTEEIRALIEGEDPPDLSRITAPGRVRYLREQFERYCLIDNMPWDELFEAAEAAQKEEEDDATSFDYGANVADDVADDVAAADAALGVTTAAKPADAPPAQAAPAAAPAAQAAPAAAPAPAAQAAPAAAPATGGRKKLAPAEPPFTPEFIPCDDCGASMREDEAKCWHCGTTYGVDLPPEKIAAYGKLGPVPADQRVKPAPKA